MKVWCVEHRHGWCAASAQKQRPKDEATSVRTACRRYVILPWRIMKRTPTCVFCTGAAKRVREASPGAGRNGR